MYQYPDFNLIYLGSKYFYSPSIDAPPGTKHFYLFVDQKGHQQEITWSSGFGLILPKKFTMGDQQFLLEPWKTVNRGYKVKKVN